MPTYKELKECLSGSQFIYGPMSKEEAFNVPVASFATCIDGQWFAGSNEDVPSLTIVAIFPDPEDIEPEVPEETPDPEAPVEPEIQP